MSLLWRMTYKERIQQIYGLYEQGFGYGEWPQ